MSNWFLFCEVWCKVKIVLVIGWKKYKLLKIPDREKQGDPPQWPPIQKQTCPGKKGVVKNFSAVHIDFTFILAAHPGGGSFSRLTISLEILFSELLLPDIFNTIFVFFSDSETICPGLNLCNRSDNISKLNICFTFYSDLTNQLNPQKYLTSWRIVLAIETDMYISVHPSNPIPIHPLIAAQRYIQMVFCLKHTLPKKQVLSSFDPTQQTMLYFMIFDPLALSECHQKEVTNQM